MYCTGVYYTRQSWLNTFTLFIIIVVTTETVNETINITENGSVYIDCGKKASEAFGDQLDNTSIAWFRGKKEIIDNSVIKNVAVFSGHLVLFIEGVTNKAIAKDGTDGTYTCRACRSGLKYPRNCTKFQTEIMAISKSSPYSVTTCCVLCKL